MSFVTRKIFDSYGMPEDLQQQLFKRFEDCPRESYVEIYVHDRHKPLKEHKGGKILYQEDDLIVEQGDDPISDWLVENGAEKGEEVLIKLP